MNSIIKSIGKALSSQKLLIIVFLIIGFVLRGFGLNRWLGYSNENLILLYYSYHPLDFIVSNYYWSGHHVFNTILQRLMILIFGEYNAH